ACGEGDNAVSENLELKADEPVTKELAANLTCHLSEKAADVAGYTHSLAFAGTGVTVTADKATATFTVPATAQGEEVRIVATNTYTPVDVPTPKVATTARAVSGEADNGKTLKPGEDATIEDTLAWENL